MRCVERVQGDAVGSNQDLPLYYYHLCQLGASITERTKKWNCGCVLRRFFFFFGHYHWSWNTHEVGQQNWKTVPTFCWISLVTICICNYSKTFPLYTIFVHLFLLRNSNSDDKKYITFVVEPGEMQYNLDSKYIITGKKCGSLL